MQANSNARNDKRAKVKTQNDKAKFKSEFKGRTTDLHWMEREENEAFLHFNL